MRVLTHELVCDPCPTTMCHASTLLPLPDGRVLCAWFGGSREGEPDVDIYLATRAADDGRWAAPMRLTAEPEPCWNPVLFASSASEIALYYKVGFEIKSWRTLRITSQDGGASWSAPRELVPADRGGRGPVRNKPIRLADGRILAPGSTEDGVWQSFADISDDGGASWRKSAPVRIDNLRYQPGQRTTTGSEIEVSEQSFYGRGVIQPTLWQDASGAHMLMRSSEGCIHRSDSTDNGDTWTHAYPTPLPNNNSGIDLARLPDGRLALVCNPVSENWGPRSPIALLLSKDDAGAHWEQVMTLDEGPGEFSYPAVVAQGDTLHISYTHRRESIAYWRIDARPENS